MAAGLAAFAVIAQPAWAGTATNNLPAKLTVLSGCQIRTSPLQFIASNPLLNVVIDATTTITLTCTPNTNYSVDIDDGLHRKSPEKRRMIGPGGDLIDYNVYMDSQRKKIWSRGKDGTVDGNSGSGAPIIIPVYGRVPVAHTLASGTYTDTLTVTVSF